MGNQQVQKEKIGKMDIPELEEYNIIVTKKEPVEEAEPIGADIDYEDPGQVRNLMAKHLSRIFIATHKRKIEKELDNVKAKCK